MDIERDAPDTFRRINSGEAPCRDPANPAICVFVYDENANFVAPAANNGLLGLNFAKKMAMLKCYQIYLLDGVFPNLITLPGLRPAAVATPIGIGAASLFAAILRSVLVNPAQRISYWGWGREGVKPLMR